MDGLVWICSMHGNSMRVYTILLRKVQGKGPLGRRRSRGGSFDNIERSFRGTRCEVIGLWFRTFHNGSLV
jgi:hypothetical protein